MDVAAGQVGPSRGQPSEAWMWRKSDPASGSWRVGSGAVAACRVRRASRGGSTGLRSPPSGGQRASRGGVDGLTGPVSCG